jgi:hypothetical protein
MKPKHLQAYLDEFAFRWNRRKTDGVARTAARVIASALTMRALVDRCILTADSGPPRQWHQPGRRGWTCAETLWSGPVGHVD